MATFRKRGDTWLAEIRRKNHPYISKTFPTKRAAQIWASEVEHTMDNRGRVSADKTKLADLFARFAEEVSPTRKGERWEQVRIRFFLKRREFAGLTVATCDDRVIRQYRDARLKEVSPSSVNREMNLLAGIFSHAIKEWGLRATNPVSTVGRPVGHDRARNLRWSDNDIAKILEASGFQEDVRPKVGREYVGWAVLLLVETAMRLGELCAVKVGDVHLVDRWLRVHDSKNGDPRDVPLSPRACELLECLVRGRAPEEKVIPVTSDTLGLYFRRERAKVKLSTPGLRIHDIRHEGTSRLATKFSNVLELSAVTGHRSLQSLRRYYNPKASDLAKRLAGPEATAPRPPGATEPASPPPGSPGAADSDPGNASGG